MGLTENQKLAVQLLNDGHKAQEVATITGFSMQQLSKWCADPAFRRERYTDVSIRFGAMVPKAMQTLMDIMETGTRDSDRLKAATEILDRAGFAVQKDVGITITDNRTPLNIDAMELRHALDVIDQEQKRLEDMKDITPAVNAIYTESEEVVKENTEV